MILDEPESGLDETAGRWLDDTLQSLKGEMTVLMVSHDSERVRRIADGVTHLRPPSRGDKETERFGAAGAAPPTIPTHPTIPT